MRYFPCCLLIMKYENEEDLVLTLIFDPPGVFIKRSFTIQEVITFFRHVEKNKYKMNSYTTVSKARKR